MRYRLRTLLIVLALGPVVLAGAWWSWPRADLRSAYDEAKYRVEAARELWGVLGKPHTSHFGDESARTSLVQTTSPEENRSALSK